MKSKRNCSKRKPKIFHTSHLKLLQLHCPNCGAVWDNVAGCSVCSLSPQDLE